MHIKDDIYSGQRPKYYTSERPMIFVRLHPGQLFSSLNPIAIALR